MSRNQPMPSRRPDSIGLRVISYIKELEEKLRRVSDIVETHTWSCFLEHMVKAVM